MIRYAFLWCPMYVFFTRAVNILGLSTMFFDTGENSSSRRYFLLVFHGCTYRSTKRVIRYAETERTNGSAARMPETSNGDKFLRKIFWTRSFIASLLRQSVEVDGELERRAFVYRYSVLNIYQRPRRGS